MSTTLPARQDATPPPDDDDARHHFIAQRRWWAALLAVVVGSFSVLIWMGVDINDNKPPIPTQVVSTDGEVLVNEGDVLAGQQVWQSIGGHQIGSVWGHGSYVAPDWTADWLHREAVHVQSSYVQERGLPGYDAASPEDKGAIDAHVVTAFRTNTYDPSTGTITISPARAAAYEANAAHYADVFMNGNVDMAIPAGTIDDPEAMRKMNAFFFWGSWAASTETEPGDATYLRNWPHEPLVDNVPNAPNILWSIISFIVLLMGIAGMVWYHSHHPEDEVTKRPPSNDPLLGYESTPSQKATLKYFFVVGALFVLQIAVGIITAHYGVEGGALYGIPIDQILPYAVARTWHTQLGILWIATAWLATGLYVGPAVGGFEPKFQRLGVNVLFGALIVVVAGSMAGQWLSITGKMGYGTPMNWWLGTTGMEYLDLARLWQIGLFIGLFLWFFLMFRSMWPAVRRAKGGRAAPTANAPLAGGSQRTLIIMLLISCFAIASFFGAAFGMGRDSHLSILEYWRWWVVHLWVEGFFEVFATVVIAFLFARLGLVRPRMATTATLAATTIFLLGGIIGTGHHLYFSGGSDAVMAWSATFSALEVVPLALMGFEAFRNLKILRVSEWVAGYKWAIYFFISVSFWNMLGAGVFGFLINPPISLFYVKGLNLTPLHAHTALFGVYGMLGIGLMLFCVRSLMPGREWNDWPLKLGFWAMNGGLLAMALLSLLPLGLAQAWASMNEGLWYARSPEFLYDPVLTVLRWMRTPGDTIFAVGALSIGLFMVGLLTGHALKDRGPHTVPGSTEAEPRSTDHADATN
ncbi:nitric-oxide reductase large subunit [Mobilicoccus caccae]|uniref:Nitric-oxide reductase large subunit n=1 Tax=Mobilicoccus caccae TaxID=1859295 RepID=A0ABQ6INP3_9MICO|nr:nitric-oxide reductase large subunit [Mobilicoccus caccae]GMA38807.1 nitric-oxide reductase large subunit [Mobilicoccus caccae]